MMPIYDYVRKDGVKSCVRPRNLVELHDALREIADNGAVSYPGQLYAELLTEAIESMGWRWKYIGNTLTVTDAFASVSFSWAYDGSETKFVFSAAVTNWETLVKLIQSAEDSAAGEVILNSQLDQEARVMELLDNMLKILEFVFYPSGELIIYVDEVEEEGDEE